MSMKRHIKAKASPHATPSFVAVMPRLLPSKRTGGAFLATARVFSGERSSSTSAPLHIQRKLTISQPRNVYGREADRIAESVAGAPGPILVNFGGPSHHTISVWREQEQAKERITGQRSFSAEMTPSLEARIWSLKTRGRRLPQTTRDYLEPRLGRDFSQVRVHAGDEADSLARAIRAEAFAWRENIVFSHGKYRPSSIEGMHLIAHELVHVMQQTGTPSAAETTVQRWSTGGHENLTKEGVTKLIEKQGGFQLDKEALDDLAKCSAAMDTKIEELVFNLGAVSAPGGPTKEAKTLGFPRHPLMRQERIPRKPLTKKEQVELLIAYYSTRSENARNHGEGGLYVRSRDEARMENLVRQYLYVRQAIGAYLELPREFHSLDECRSKKSRVRKRVFNFLGDALHVTQDRGAHGEGAAGEGHAMEIEEGIDPDDPGENAYGYLEARANTATVLNSVKDMLLELLNERYSVTCAFSRPGEIRVMRKLTISQSGDKYEQEADRLADAVMRMSESAVGPKHENGDVVEEQMTRAGIQPLEASHGFDSRVKAIFSSGQPLPGFLRAFFDPRFGVDFGQVRICTDAGAADMARRINAPVFTVGRHIVFRSDQYAPYTTMGKKLLAHELAHVIQQGFCHDQDNLGVKRKSEKWFVQRASQEKKHDESSEVTKPKIDYLEAKEWNKSWSLKLGWTERLEDIREWWAVLWFTDAFDLFADEVAAFQVEQGFRGKEIDGVLGPRTWDRLRPIGEVIASMRRVQLEEAYKLVCTVATKERMRKGYRRGTGEELVPKKERAPLSLFHIILHSIPEYMHMVPDEFKGTGAAGASVYLGKGILVTESDIWDKKALKPGSVIQAWYKASDLVLIQGGEHTPSCVAGHSFVFLEYVGNDEMKVLQYGGEVKKKKRSTYQVWFGANWLPR